MTNQVYISLNRTQLVNKPDRTYDWHAYNQGFEPTVLSPGDFYAEVGRGSSFAPVFEGRRAQENFYLAQHIALDFDNKEGVRWDVERFLSHPFVLAYGGFVYPTLSSTEIHPRYRLVFVLDDPIRSAEGYKLALQTVHNIFADADPSCIDISRSFFGNGKIAQDDLWQQCHYIGKDLKLADLRVYAKNYLAEQRRLAAAGRRRVTPVHVPDSSGSALTLAEVMERLQGVDPYALNYGEWVKLASAIQREFGETAFGLFKRWSDVPGKQELTWKKWKSFGASHPNPAGSGSIIEILRKYGRAA